MTTKEINEITKAVLEGKPIQVKNNGVWETIYGEPQWHFDHCNYRIKPEPKRRPYANAEEFLQAQKEHGPYLNFKSYIAGSEYAMPIELGQENLYFYDRVEQTEMCLEYMSLLNEEITWQDGTPCGIIEEEQPC